MLIAALVALLVMLVEAISWNGLDNLLIPLSSYFLLLLVFQLPIQILLLDLAVVLSLLASAPLFVRSRSVGKNEETPC